MSKRYHEKRFANAYKANKWLNRGAKRYLKQKLHKKLRYAPVDADINEIVAIGRVKAGRDYRWEV